MLNCKPEHTAAILGESMRTTLLPLIDERNSILPARRQPSFKSYDLACGLGLVFAICSSYYLFMRSWRRVRTESFTQK